MRKSKKILVISDTHCGHRSGLISPEMDSRPGGGNTDALERFAFRRWHWDKFSSVLDTVGKVDIVIANGDLIDGPEPGSGGTELILVDRQDQVAVATDVLKHIKGSPKFFLSYGTGYHTGNVEDWERDIAKAIGGKIGDEDNISVNGVVINYRHHLSGSSVPHGRFTAIAREKLWKDIWALRGEYPTSNIIIRSHVHYHSAISGYDIGPWIAFSTPALQGYHSKYSRRVTGTVDMGVVLLEIEDGDFSFRPIIWRQEFKAPVDAG